MNECDMNQSRLYQVGYKLLLGVLIAYLVSMGISYLICGKTTFFGVKPFKIMSASMEDTIMTGQWVLAVPVNPEDVREGDIIAYRSDEKLVMGLISETVIHRVISIQSEEQGNKLFIFKGDNNVLCDDPVEESQILYKIIKY